MFGPSGPWRLEGAVQEGARQMGVSGRVAELGG